MWLVRKGWATIDHINFKRESSMKKIELKVSWIVLIQNKGG
jgi:hypothetical protein